MMQMTLYWSPTVTILFDWWMSENYLEFFASCFFFFVLTMTYEWIVSRRANASKRVEGTLIHEEEAINATASWKSATHFKLTGLYAIQNLIGVVVMLGIMTYNVGILLSIIFGYTFGFLFWGHCRHGSDVSHH